MAITTVVEDTEAEEATEVVEVVSLEYYMII